MRRQLIIIFTACAMLASYTAAHTATAHQKRAPLASRTAADDDADKTIKPGETLRRARTLYVEPSRRIDREYVQYKLLKTSQLAAWNITVVEDVNAADLILRLDQILANYLFKIVDSRTSAVIVSGKVVAINDPVAADFLGIEIIKKMREVRGMD